jgi:hypothetical protein
MMTKATANKIISSNRIAVLNDTFYNETFLAKIVGQTREALHTINTEGKLGVFTKRDIEFIRFSD